MDENMQNNINPQNTDSTDKKSRKNKYVVITVIGIFLLSVGGAFGALYSDMWNPTWDPFSESTNDVVENINIEAKSEENKDETIFDIDTILGKHIDEVRNILGEQDSWIWDKGNFIVSIKEIRGITNIVDVIEVTFPKLDKPTYKELLSAAGIKIPLTTPEKDRFDMPYFYFLDKYGTITFPLLSNPHKTSDYSIYVQTQDVMIKEMANNIACAAENYFEKSGSYFTTNDTLFLISENNKEDIAPLLELCGVAENYRFPKKPLAFGYKSDGSTYYEVTAPIQYQDDPQCLIDNNLCLYKIRNGKITSIKNFLVEKNNFSVEIEGLWAEYSTSEETGLEIYDVNEPSIVGYGLGNGNDVTVIENYEDHEDFEEVGSIEQLFQFLNDSQNAIIDGVLYLEKNNEGNGFNIIEESLCGIEGQKEGVGTLSYLCGAGNGERYMLGFASADTQLNNGNSYLFILENEETEEMDLNVMRGIIESFKTK